MNRRTFLCTASLAGVATTAGCLSDVLGSSSDEPPLAEGRPDAVYYPTHVEGMEMADMGMPGPYKIALSYSFPHRFWLITGQDREQVDIQEEDAIHLMGTIWDEETGRVIPASNLSVDLRKDGESVASRRVWPMLSQNMGFHFGDNVPLDGDGTYEAEVTIDPVQARRTGAFEGQFEESASTTLEFEFSQETLDGVMYRDLEEQQGQKGAVSPMEMDMMPLSRTPEQSELPGSFVGEATSGDGVFLVTTLDEPPAGVDASGTYLAVSPRTPYNRFPLPMMSLSATLERDGDAVYDGVLEATLDPDLGYHYGAAVDSVESGDELELSVGAPPQVSRHEGYETAFYEMPAMQLTV